MNPAPVVPSGRRIAVETGNGGRGPVADLSHRVGDTSTHGAPGGRHRPPPDPLPASRRCAFRLPLAPLLTVMALVLIASVVMSLAFGAERVPVGEVWEAVRGRLSGQPLGDSRDIIVWDLRLPRALLAVTVGAGLAISGVSMQTLVRNPLADPYLLGVSAGASAGAAAALTIGAFAGFGASALQVGALTGALAASFTVYAVARAQGGLTPIRLVLSGVVLSAGFAALASFLVFVSDQPRAAEQVMFWMLGSVARAQFSGLLVPAVATVVALSAMLAVHGWLDALVSGDDAASSLGVPVGAVRTGLFVLQGVLVGLLVAAAGGIGFVGLIIPHAARLLVGGSHRRLLPVAALSGGLFLLWVDVLSRVVAAPQEMPLGVVTGIIGAPVFLLLLGRRRYSFGSER
ncbi:iron ABC transporter permease [Dietzia sp. CQ4]|nr:iron ABC transporter permease [Dietzia sp. CQ4]